MKHRKISSSQWKPTPWKNGDGKSVELAIFPETASLEKGDFLWRISIAQLERSGPFSVFPGYDRAMVRIAGTSVILRHDEGEMLQLSDTLPHYFSGDAMTECELMGRQAADINAMVQRTWGKVQMTCHEAVRDNAMTFRSNADAILIYCQEGKLQIHGAPMDRSDQPMGSLESRDSLLIETGTFDPSTDLKISSIGSRAHYVITEIVAVDF